jgi:hypothetical protein
MNALKLQHTSETVRAGASWSWVGAGAAAVLILIVLSIALARDLVETSPPASGGAVAEIQTDVPMAPRDLVLHGRGLVDLPDVATAVGGTAAVGAGSKANTSTTAADGASSGDAFIRPIQARCPAKPGC